MSQSVHRQSPEPALVSSREKILEVSEALFARSGFAGVGMREVAQQVGLGKSSLFHHFPSKLKLYSEVLARATARLGERVTPALGAECGVDERLERWLVALIDMLAEDPHVARIFMRGLFEDDPFLATGIEARDPEAFEEMLFELIGGFQDLIAQGIEEGVFHRVSLADTTQTMIGLTVYHFASGEFGEALFGESLFSAAAVRRRKREVLSFVRRSLLKEPHAAGSA